MSACADELRKGERVSSAHYRGDQFVIRAGECEPHVYVGVFAHVVITYHYRAELGTTTCHVRNGVPKDLKGRRPHGIIALEPGCRNLDPDSSRNHDGCTSTHSVHECSLY